MKTLTKRILFPLLIPLWSCFSVGVHADFAPGFIVNSPGLPGATITIDGTVNVGPEWTGADHQQIDYGAGDPLTADVYALHKSDGIYLGIIVQDTVFNPSDSLKLYFDLNHNHSGSAEPSDWGVEIDRNGQANWGAANIDPGTWVAVPGANFAVNDAGGQWSAEFRLPPGAPSGLVISDANVGVYFSIYNADLAFSPTSAKYTQWPIPADLNNLLDDEPIGWGNYVFDLPSTFPDISVTGVRNRYGGSENYYKISHTANNIFEVRLNNPGGTAIPNASNVRVNLYLAARGIGEPWHRLDTAAMLDADCTTAPADWPSTVVSKNQVCSGNTSLDDISAQTIDDIVNNTADYTIKNGTPMTRLGGNSITVNGGTNNWLDIIEWDTTANQDARFTEAVVDSTTYRRQHQCMKAEALVPNDPDAANNLKQVNMDFVCVPGATLWSFFFSLGWAGFGEYDPDNGKEMFLQVIPKNMPAGAGWSYALKDVKKIGDDVYKALIRGKKSLSVQLDLTAPKESPLGDALKENLMVPPKAGGANPHVDKKSGENPVYVKVAPNATIWVINYEFNEKDVQHVDIDGKRGKYPPSGPRGFPIKEGKGGLLFPEANPGALIGSFDNFNTAFLVGEGVRVRVPDDATHLALGINDFIGEYRDNSGTGFRVKLTQQQSAAIGDLKIIDKIISSANAATKAKVRPVSVLEELPVICVNGYESINTQRAIGGTKHDLYRYLGRVCWTVINVYPPDRSQKPDVSDPGPGDDWARWWWLILLLILVILFFWWKNKQQS